MRDKITKSECSKIEMQTKRLTAIKKWIKYERVFSYGEKEKERERKEKSIEIGYGFVN